jgi:hypothetical protein
LPGGDEANYKKTLRGQLVSEPRSEPGTSCFYYTIRAVINKNEQEPENYNLRTNLPNQNISK